MLRMKVLVTSSIGETYSIVSHSYDCDTEIGTSINSSFVLALFDTDRSVIDIILLCIDAGEFGCSWEWGYLCTPYHTRLTNLSRYIKRIEDLFDPVRNSEVINEILFDILVKKHVELKKLKRDDPIVKELKEMLSEILGDGKSFKAILPFHSPTDDDMISCMKEKLEKGMCESYKICSSICREEIERRRKECEENCRRKCIEKVSKDYEECKGCTSTDEDGCED